MSNPNTLRQGILEARTVKHPSRDPEISLRPTGPSVEGGKEELSRFFGEARGRGRPVRAE